MFRMAAKIHFICNGVFSTNIAGGDIHFLKLAEAAARAGYELNFWGGTALREIIERHKLPGTVTLTDDAKMPKVNQGALGGQITMFRDFFGRCRRTFQLLNRIAPEDCVYAVSDYWFDVLPAVRCAARRKLMILHMEAPTFSQILWRSRPDVDGKRLASLHYFLSQNLSLSAFRSCQNKRLLYVHPNIKRNLLRKGFQYSELVFVSAGFDPATADRIPEQAKQFDVAWIGRVHRQKGIDDLVATLAYLAAKLPDFKAIIIGAAGNQLRPFAEKAGLENRLQFTGFVSETEKFRLLKASRIFLMPSHYESWGAVIAEALAAELPVVAYELEAYRPVFGGLVRYVPPFNLQMFQIAAWDELCRARAGHSQPDLAALSAFKQKYAWEAVSARFVQTLNSLADVR
jgi:glycosyltransferase involved in cell wall biosynthesis